MTDSPNTRGSSPKNKWFQYSLGFLISGALIVWLIFAIEWRLVLRQMTQVHYIWFVPFSLGFLLQMFFRAERWRYLLPETEQQPSRLMYYDGIFVGNFINYILPLRLGELARPFFLSQRSSFSFPTIFVSVIIERFVDVSFVLVSFGIMSMYIKNIPTWIHRGAFVFTLISGGIFLFIVLASMLPNHILKLARVFFRYLPERLSTSLENFLVDFLAGAKVVSRPKNFLGVTIYSLILWIVAFAQYWSLLYMFPDLTFTYWHGVAITVLIALAIAAPSAPGFIGVYQVSCIAGFLLFGWDKERATTYAIISHMLQYLIVILYGLSILFRYDLTLKDLQKPSEPE